MNVFPFLWNAYRNHTECVLYVGADNCCHPIIYRTIPCIGSLPKVNAFERKSLTHTISSRAFK